MRGGFFFHALLLPSLYSLYACRRSRTALLTHSIPAFFFLCVKENDEFSEFSLNAIEDDADCSGNEQIGGAVFDVLSVPLAGTEIFAFSFPFLPLSVSSSSQSLHASTISLFLEPSRSALLLPGNEEARVPRRFAVCFSLIVGLALGLARHL